MIFALGTASLLPIVAPVDEGGEDQPVGAVEGARGPRCNGAVARLGGDG